MGIFFLPGAFVEFLWSKLSAEERLNRANRGICNALTCTQYALTVLVFPKRREKLSITEFLGGKCVLVFFVSSQAESSEAV